MEQSIPRQNETEITTEEDVCIGCTFSKRSVLQTLTLMVKKGPRYRKEGCPGKFVGLAKQYSVIELPRVGVVTACPDRESWETITARYPEYPQESLDLNGRPWTIGMDRVQQRFEQHINKIEG